jgi:predicted nucleic acid-binding protein
MVAAVCVWHQHQRAAAAEIERRLAGGERLVVPAPALLEAYSVLTRLPPPHRLSADQAWSLIEANFVVGARIFALNGPAHVRILRGLARQGTGGGRAYDAVIAECAREANAGVLLTFNRKHFDPAPEGVLVVEPAV